MTRARKFDWDEAARLYAEIQNYTEVARRLGVTVTALRRALIPEERTKMAERHARWQSETRPWIGVCPDCGGPAANGRGQSVRCTDCFAKQRAVSVRDDTLRCALCRLWLPDSEFGPHRYATKLRRGRRSWCRACSATHKRDLRAAARPA